MNGGTSRVPFALIHGFELSVTAGLTTLAIIFTVHPDLLTHAPVGFESRGIIHHVWHYALLTGALMSFLGLVTLRTRIELTGLVILIGALLINLTALVSVGDDQLGLAATLRGAVIVGLGLRAYLLAVYLPHLAARVNDVSRRA